MGFLAAREGERKKEKGSERGSFSSLLKLPGERRKIQSVVGRRGNKLVHVRGSLEKGCIGGGGKRREEGTRGGRPRMNSSL